MFRRTTFRHPVRFAAKYPLPESYQTIPNETAFGRILSSTALTRVEIPMAKGRSGPRAPAGKRPLTVIIDETLIEDAKIAAIRDRTNVSRVADELARGWLSGLLLTDP